MKTLPHTPILTNCSKEHLLNYFQNSWELESTLLRSITNEEAFYVSPDRLRNRLIFYLGHSAVFYINKLIRVGLLEKRINDYLQLMLENGIVGLLLFIRGVNSREELSSAFCVFRLNWWILRQFGTFTRR